MGGHGRGKKRLRYQIVEGHKFPYKRGGAPRGELSMCGLTLEEALQSPQRPRCKPCVKVAEQLWA